MKTGDAYRQSRAAASLADGQRHGAKGMRKILNVELYARYKKWF
jgi:hypothetical protein